MAEWLPGLEGVAEPEVVVRLIDEEQEVAFVPRLGKSELRVHAPGCLTLTERGSVENLRVVAQTERASLAEGGLEMRVRAVGLNFRDVLNVMDIN